MRGLVDACLLAALACGATSGALAVDPWAIDADFAAFAVADAHWTVNEDFPGRKLIFDGRYAMRRTVGVPRARACACDPAPAPVRLFATVGAHLQWGAGESALEYGVLTVAAYSSQRDFAAEAGAGLQPFRDTVEWGVLRLSKDEPLGIESYAELTVARGARTWQHAAPDSPWRFTVGVNVSGGFAWADSADETFQDVSNLIAGTWVKATAARGRWGAVYLEQRVVNGWTLSSPARGGSVSREARARLGYVRALGRCMNLEVFAEKRSFNFADPVLQNLYTASKRVGAQVDCTF